jgi:nitrous oxidase accessory protein NosD
MFRKYALGSTVLLILVAGPALCSDGAIPIWEPTTITAPGHYVLTRDITSSAPYTIGLSGVSDVYIDLNGFTVENTASGHAIEAVNADKFAVTNGIVKGGNVYIDSSEDVKITHLRVQDCDNSIYLDNGSSGEVAHNTVIRSNLQGINVYAGGQPVKVTDNLVEDGSGTGIYMNGCIGCYVARNVVHDCYAGFGLMLFNVDYSLIESNVLTENGWGFEFGATSEYNVFRGNISRGSPFYDFNDAGTGNTSNRDNYMPNAI